MKLKSNSSKERSIHVNYKVMFDENNKVIGVDPSSFVLKNTNPKMAIATLISIMFQGLGNLAKRGSQITSQSEDDLKASLLEEMLNQFEISVKSFLS